MNNKVEIAKNIIRENFSIADCGLFNSHNIAGDKMTNIYNKDGLSIDICYDWSYFEVFGLTEVEFYELLYYYDNIQETENEE